MKILLDEQLPVKLQYRLRPELTVSTVRDEQWLGVKNGNLIQLAVNSGFTILITNDKNLHYQQKLIQFKILFINVNETSNRYEDVLPAILAIKKWLIANETVIEIISKTNNYFVYPDSFR